MTRHVLCLMLLVGTATPLLGGDRSPAPVDPEIIQNPQVTHIPVLMAALRGSGCRPKHSAVGDTLVKLGKPSVAPLVNRLQSSTKWWEHLECVHLLGLIGTDAKAAIPVLEEYLSVDHHPLPKRYARISLAAIRGSTSDLMLEVNENHSVFSEFALELLDRMGEEAEAGLPLLKAFIADQSKRAHLRKMASEILHKFEPPAETDQKKVTSPIT